MKFSFIQCQTLWEEPLNFWYSRFKYIVSAVYSCFIHEYFFCFDFKTLFYLKKYLHLNVDNTGFGGKNLPFVQV